jgi:hypothetical protein
MSDIPSYIEETNELATLALREAKFILQFGPSQQKIQIVKSVLGVLARQAAAGQEAMASDMRHKMEVLMADMRNVPALTTVVTDHSFVEAEIVDET